MTLDVHPNGAVEVEMVSGERVTLVRRNVAQISEQGGLTLVTPSDGAPFLTPTDYATLRDWWCKG